MRISDELKTFIVFSYVAYISVIPLREPSEVNDNIFRNVYGKFVTACEANYTLGTGCTVDESLLTFRGRCCFKQYILKKKLSKYGIKIYVLADSKTFYSVFSIIYMGTYTHAPGLQVPNQVVLNLVPTILGTNINTDNYYTSISLAKEIKSRKIILVGTMKEEQSICSTEYFGESSRRNSSLFCQLFQRRTILLNVYQTMQFHKRTDIRNSI